MRSDGEGGEGEGGEVGERRMMGRVMGGDEGDGEGVDGVEG